VSSSNDICIINRCVFLARERRNRIIRTSLYPPTPQQVHVNTTGHVCSSRWRTYQRSSFCATVQTRFYFMAHSLDSLSPKRLWAPRRRRCTFIAKLPLDVASGDLRTDLSRLYTTCGVDYGGLTKPNDILFPPFFLSNNAPLYGARRWYSTSPPCL